MRSITVSIFGGVVAVALLLSAGAAAAGREPSGASSGPALAAKTTPRVLTCLGHPETKPGNYLLSCADANASWMKVIWSSWGAKTASGTGDLYQNDCSPNCAAGHFHTYPAKITLWDVTQTKKYGPLYAKATFSYSVNGKHESETFGLVTSGLSG
jgi:hypothetical protein